MFRTSDYHFDLPSHLIAQAPSARRSESRLLDVQRHSGIISHRSFGDLPELFSPGDVLVLNETRVFPARLIGQRRSGGDAEIFLLHPMPEGPELWTALVRPGAKLKPGRSVVIGQDLEVEIVASTPGGERIVRLSSSLGVDEAIQRYGSIPLPPYVTRSATEEDRERYQTVYARQPGSVAAPTAGLHFTPELLEAIEARGVNIARLVLHVGVGTFRPIEVEDPGDHVMHSEWYEVPEAAAAMINSTKAAGGAVWAVGTTSVRTLETAVSESGRVQNGSGWTDIFIRPPHHFQVVDSMITNFHLPRSTLLMLVAAFAGYDLVMEAYRQAIAQEYRFYSYGDAMVIR